MIRSCQCQPLSHFNLLGSNPLPLYKYVKIFPELDSFGKSVGMVISCPDPCLMPSRIPRFSGLSNSGLAAKSFELGECDFYQLRMLRPALVYKAGCTCVTLYCSQIGRKRCWSKRPRLLPYEGKTGIWR
jgi:hypothetical protein